MTVVTTLKHCVVAPPVQLQNYVSWVFHESEASQERHQLEDTYERDSGPSNCASTWVVSTCTVLVLLILVGTLTYLPTEWKGKPINETEVSKMLARVKSEEDVKNQPIPSKPSQLCLRHCGDGVVYAACDCTDRCDCSKAVKFLKNNLTSHEMCYVFCMPSGRILSASCKEFNPDVCADFVLSA
uniref:Uncharacterized protein n=1 Tax=Trichuris muris TaxID=70415 RepID=A0A5S6Q9D0_TRIMR